MVPIPDELPLDHSVYPDLETPPVTLATDPDKADYLHRVCAALPHRCAGC